MKWQELQEKKSQRPVAIHAKIITDIFFYLQAKIVNNY